MFNGAPFGLKPLPSIFQRVMSRVLASDSASNPFMDDVLVATKPRESHGDALRRTVDCLTRHNLTLNPEKLKLAYAALRCLGHFISEEGVQPDPDKWDKVQAWEPPKNTKEMQAFLGLMNYFRDFIPRFSEVAAPLYALTYSRDIPRDWTDVHQRLFESLKRLLTAAPVISAPDFDLPMYVAVELISR